MKITSLLQWCFGLGAIFFVGSSVRNISSLWYPAQCDALSAKSGSPDCFYPSTQIFTSHHDISAFLVATGTDDAMKIYSGRKGLKRAGKLAKESNSAIQIFSKRGVNIFDLHELEIKNLNISVPFNLLNSSWSVLLYCNVISQEKNSKPADIFLVSSFTRYLQKMDAGKILLLSNDNSKDTDISDETDNIPVAHYRPILTLNIVDDQTIFPIQNIPSDVPYKYFQSKEKYFYRPLMEIDTFGVLHTDWMPIPPDGNFSIDFQFRTMGLGMFRLIRRLEFSTSILSKDFGLNEKDIDDMKSIFTKTSVEMLVLTYIVTIFHVFFDFLAFKSDVMFWKNRQDFGGLSARTVIANAFSTFIIVLFLYNENDTSWLILSTTGLALLIELWKIARLMRLGQDSTNKNKSKLESLTETLDKKATNLLSKLLFPLVFIYGTYSLIYQPQKNLWSWFIETAAHSVYTLGFITMTPQLFINYHLKSVAHLPFEVFMYKAFNTFIDDIFSFIISMPTAHRVACFRDDIIFFVYLYQRYLYPVDTNRTNEYGQSYGDGIENQAVKENKKKK